MQADVAANREVLCFSQLRFYPLMLRERLRREKLWEDLAQEIRLAAWEAERRGLSKTETCRLAGRRIYAFLKSCGYRVYKHRYYKPEQPYPLFADPPVRELDDVTVSPPVFIGEDHLKETILAILKEHPEGMAKGKLYNRLGLSAKELDWHCAPLIKQGLVVEVKKENHFGRPLNPLLVAVEPGRALPVMIPSEKMERIRQAYLEGKGIKQIARELHHDIRTVRKALVAGGIEVKGAVLRRKYRR